MNLAVVCWNVMIEGIDFTEWWWWCQWDKIFLRSNDVFRLMHNNVYNEILIIIIKSHV